MTNRQWPHKPQIKNYPDQDALGAAFAAWRAEWADEAARYDRAHEPGDTTRYRIERLSGYPHRHHEFAAATNTEALVIADAHVNEWRKNGYYGGCQLLHYTIDRRWSLVIVYGRE